MLFGRRLKSISTIVLILVLISALAPLLASFASPASAKSFVQEICSKNGERFFLNVVTTKGNKISTLINVKTEQKQASLTHQFDHCPFCSFATDHTAVATVNVPYLFFQQAQSKLLFDSGDAPRSSFFLNKSHPTRAPPNISALC